MRALVPVVACLIFLLLLFRQSTDNCKQLWVIVRLV
ncbi:hypothetical protein EniLVp02_0037 [Vibrio phage EniLVp02]